MTKLSLVPEIAQHYGLSFTELLYRLLEDASTKGKKIRIIILILLFFLTTYNYNQNIVFFHSLKLSRLNLEVII